MSKDILFFPKQASGVQPPLSRKYNGRWLSPVQGTDNPFLWLPYEDELEIESRNVPFDMYGEPEVVAEGKLRYGGKGLFSVGELRYGTAA